MERHHIVGCQACFCFIVFLCSLQGNDVSFSQNPEKSLVSQSLIMERPINEASCMAEMKGSEM